MIWITQNAATKPNSRVVSPGDYSGITLELFKKHLKWDASDTSEDDLMTVMLKSAIMQAESYTRRVIEPASWVTYLNGFSTVYIDVLPIDLESVAVKYLDTNSAEQTLDEENYTITNYGYDSYPKIEFTGTLPSADNVDEPVWIEYDAGYATYPSDLTAIILRHAADLFENRTNDLPSSIDSVTMNFHKSLFPYKIL